MSRALRTVAIAMACAIPALQSAFAQGETTYDQGEFLIVGIPAECSDVYTIVRSTSDQLIYAPDGLNIIIDGPAFEQYSPGLRLFMYHHTCAQMFYGEQYQFADRFVARIGVERGWLTAADAEALCVERVLNDVWPASPDSERCEIIRETMIEALP